MEELKELIQVVINHTNSVDQHLGVVLGQSRKMLVLFDAVANGKIQNDREGCRLLYNDDTKMTNYRGVKNRLKDRLLDAVLFVGSGKVYSTDTSDALVRAHRNWTTVRILMSSGADIAAAKLSERAYKEARKYEFTTVCRLLSRFLALFFGVVLPNQKKHAYYLNQYEVHSFIEEGEAKAEMAYAQACNLRSSTQGVIEEHELVQFTSLSKHIEREYGSIDSRRFIQMNGMFEVMLASLYNDNEKILDISTSAIRKLSSRLYDFKRIIAPFQRNILSCYINMERFDEGRQLALTLLDKMTVNSYNWFLTLFYKYILFARSMQYQECYDIYQTVKRSKSYYKLSPNLKELWRVNEAYTQFLIARGKITPDSDEEVKTFRIYRFLNQMPIFSRDKRGINIAILIIHVLFLLHQNKRDKIIDRVDALNRYCYRHLRRDETFRSNCFIQMLLQASNAQFNRIRTERYAEEYKKKLASMPLKEARQSIEVEVFPYEHLWEMVLEMLD